MKTLAFSALVCCLAAISPSLEINARFRPPPPCGSWLVLKAREDGRSLKTGNAEFKKKRLTLKLGLDTLECACDIDTSQTPWRIFLLVNGRGQHGIAREQGGMLEIYLTSAENPPPKVFDPDTCSLYLLLTPKR
jgi:hypothetical protein